MSTSVKTCFRCGADKPMTEFYRHPEMADGHLGKCKACTLVDVKQHREKNIDRLRAYDRNRAKHPERRAHARRIAVRWTSNHPERRAAQIAVGNAIRDGKLKKQACEVCASPRVHAHHDDYSAPLSVRWLCAAHHKQYHISQLKSANTSREMK